ncbi:DUF2255 family protein [Actinoplanes sp. Pm04-4]|uniref:DUF2255 family protein n=1 Tax=Paractinoplanes pyxinae TaxID=2997416 RepID=A0ABT4AS32_9ACTN|nr:DUF2255 family protein [Actinoplanes pyxinae]MCY1137041.1 DUF2255 family protein [Actinoplanes pyxinae]
MRTPAKGVMADGWTAEELLLIEAADELEIAAERVDGTSLRWAPIWVVRVGEQVFVRSWHRRETGWFGHVVRSGRAGIRVPGLEAAVVVEDVGAGAEDVRAAVDAAYRVKYQRYGGGAVGPMVTPAAAATTLRLSPVEQRGTGRGSCRGGAG